MGRRQMDSRPCESARNFFYRHKTDTVTGNSCSAARRTFGSREPVWASPGVKNLESRIMNEIAARSLGYRAGVRTRVVLGMHPRGTSSGTCEASSLSADGL